MAKVQLPRLEFDKGSKGALYGVFISLTGGVSDTYKLPVTAIYGFGAHIVNGNLTVTYDSPDRIDSDNAIFFAYDPDSLSNLAITGFKFTHTSGTATCTISVKASSV